ncbi:hypothetical protein JCM17204_12690 [Blautia stercoris]
MNEEKYRCDKIKLSNNKENLLANIYKKYTKNILTNPERIIKRRNVKWKKR